MIISIKRNKVDEQKLYGYIIKESDKFILINREYDFEFDGFQIIRKKDVTGREISQSNKYCMKIMKSEGNWIIKHPKWIKNLDLTSWDTIFNGIHSDVLIVENENDSGSYCIGSVMDVKKNKVMIKYFDSVGKWGEDEWVLYRSITTCKFLDRYSSTHAKYLKNLPNKRMHRTS